MPMSDDPFQLQRFLDAQAPVYERVLKELQAGQKQSHWMWFVFPQVAGLGSTVMAQRYAIASLEEARAYWQHPELGPRLVACTRLINAVSGRSIRAILGTPDDLKFRSSLTLFLQVAPGQPDLQLALDSYYEGEPDPRTLALLGLA